MASDSDSKDGDETTSDCPDETDSDEVTLSPANDDGAPGSAADGASEEEESDDEDFINNMELTDAGYRRALTAEHTQMPRPNRRPTRAEKGTYTDNADLAQEITDIAHRIPDDKPVYDLRETAPHLYEPRSEELEEMMARGEEKFKEMLTQSGWNQPNMEAVGQRPIFNWLVRMRLDTSGVSNPVNRKVVCKVYLRELQEQRGLTDAALQHIARVAGPRYNPKTGLLRISSEVYPKREENRIHIMDLINNLVEEGDRVHPAPGGLNNATPAERKDEAFENHFAEMWDQLDLESADWGDEHEDGSEVECNDRANEPEHASGTRSEPRA